MERDLPDRLSVDARVLAAHLRGEAVLLHLESKRYFRLNETGAVVWQGLERGLERDEMVRELTERFQVSEEEAREATDSLLRELLDEALVTPAAPEEEDE